MQDFIYPKIEPRHGLNAPKITGMIMGHSMEELICLVQNEEALFEKSDEILKVWNDSLEVWHNCYFVQNIDHVRTLPYA